MHWTHPLDGIGTGAVLHRLEGIVRAVVDSISFDEQTGHFEARIEWHDSYVAEQHVHHYGVACGSRMCWSLVGYVSGYASACCGRDIYFRELSCSAQGHEHCICRRSRRCELGRGAGKPPVRLSRAQNLVPKWSGCEKPFKRNSTKSPKRERLLEKRERETRFAS